MCYQLNSLHKNSVPFGSSDSRTTMHCKELSARQVLTVDTSSADMTPTGRELFMMPPILDLHILCPPSILEIIFLRLFLHLLIAIITGRSLFTLSVMDKLDLSAAYNQNNILFPTYSLSCLWLKCLKNDCTRNTTVLCFPPPPKAI